MRGLIRSLGLVADVKGRVFVLSQGGRVRKAGICDSPPAPPLAKLTAVPERA